MDAALAIQVALHQMMERMITAALIGGGIAMVLVFGIMLYKASHNVYDPTRR